MGFDLDVCYGILTVDLEFVRIPVIGDVQVEKLERFLVIFDVHGVFDVFRILLVQYVLKSSRRQLVVESRMTVINITNERFWCNRWVLT